MIRTRQDAASKLLSLETEERRLCARMQRDRVRRNLIQDEITTLRCTMTEADAERYRKARWREERL